jgi:hypothetical protein
VLVSLGRSYIKVQCGAQFGWLDVRDNLIIVDVGTKVSKGRVHMKWQGAGREGGASRRRKRSCGNCDYAYRLARQTLHCVLTCGYMTTNNTVPHCLWLGMWALR